MNKTVRKILWNTRQDGGITLDEYGDEIILESGFIVSEKDGLKISWDNKDLVKNVSKFLNRNLKKGVMLGFWSYDGYLYMDKNQHIADIETAKKIGVKNFQIAIWDCKNGKEILL